MQFRKNPTGFWSRTLLVEWSCAGSACSSTLRGIFGSSEESSGRAVWAIQRLPGQSGLMDTVSQSHRHEYMHGAPCRRRVRSMSMLHCSPLEFQDVICLTGWTILQKGPRENRLRQMLSAHFRVCWLSDRNLSQDADITSEWGDAFKAESLSAVRELWAKGRCSRSVRQVRRPSTRLQPTITSILSTGRPASCCACDFG